MSNTKKNKNSTNVLTEFGIPIFTGIIAVLLLALTTIESAISLPDSIIYRQLIGLVLLSITFLLFFFGLRKKYYELWDKHNEITFAQKQIEDLKDKLNNTEKLTEKQAHITSNLETENIEQTLKNVANQLLQDFDFTGLSVWALDKNAEKFEAEFIYRKYQGVLQKSYFRPFSPNQNTIVEFPISMPNPIQTLTEQQLRPAGLVQEIVFPIRLENQKQALCCFENRIEKTYHEPQKNTLSSIASMIGLWLQLRSSNSQQNLFLSQKNFIQKALRKNTSGIALFRLSEPISTDENAIVQKLKSGKISVEIEQYSQGLLALTEAQIEDFESPSHWYSMLNYEEIFPKFTETGFGKLNEEIQVKNRTQTQFFQLFLTGIIENGKLVGWWHLQTDITTFKTDILEKSKKSNLFEKLYFSLLNFIPERQPSEGQKIELFKKLLPKICQFFGYQQVGIWELDIHREQLISKLVFAQKKGHFIDDLEIDIDNFIHLKNWSQPLFFGENEAEHFEGFMKNYRQENQLQKLIVLPVQTNKKTKEIILLEDSKTKNISQEELVLFQKIAQLASIYYSFTENRNLLTNWKTVGKSYQGFLKNTDYAVAKFALDIPISLKTGIDTQIKAIREFALLSECNSAMKTRLNLTQNTDEFPHLSFQNFIQNLPETEINLLFINILKPPYRFTNTHSIETDFDGKEKRFLKSYICVTEGDFITGIWILQREVTALTRGEATILKSEKLFRAVSEYQREPLAVLNSEGKFLYSNLRLKENFGYSFSEVKRKKLTDFIYPDDENHFNLLLQKIIQNPDTNQTIETQFLHQSGIWHQVELFMSNEATDTLVISFRDITQQRKTETQAQLRETRLHQIFDANADPIFVVNLRGRITFANHQAQETTGRPLDEIASHWIDFIHDTEQKKAEQYLKKIQSSKVPLTEFFRFQNDKLGSWRNVRIFAQNFIKNSALKGILMQITDLQDYRVENRNLLQKLNRRNQLLETTREGMAVLDSEGYFRYANQAFAQILGLKSAQTAVIEKMNFKDFLSLDNQEIISKFEYILQKNELNFSEGFYLQKVDKNTIWVEGFMINLLRHEHVSGIIFGIWENTSQKHQLDDLIDKEESMRLFLENSAQISAFTDLNGRVYSSAGFNDTFGKPTSDHDVFSSNYYPKSAEHYTEEGFRRVWENGTSIHRILKRKNASETVGDYLHHLQKVQNTETGKQIILADFIDKTELLAREADLRFHQQILEDEHQDKKKLIAQHQVAQETLEQQKEEEIQRLIQENQEKIKQLTSAKEQIIQKFQSEIERLSDKLSRTEKPALLGRTLAQIAEVLQKPIIEIQNNLPELRRMLEEFREIADKYTEINPEIDLVAKLQEIELLKEIADFENLNQETDNLLERQAELAENIVRITHHLDIFAGLENVYSDSLDLNQIAENVLLLLDNQFQSRIELVKKYAENAKIAGYTDQIGAMLIGLLHNAIEAISENGYIFIDTWNTPDAVGISIKDTGKGIDNALQKQVFERFFTTKDPQKHAGTGLNMVQDIVQAHGGNISLESDSQKGTKVSILFPKKNN